MKPKYRSILLIIAVGSLFLFNALSTAAKEGDTGYLKTEVNPGRAGVFVDGKYLGPAANFRISRKYPLPAGEHEVQLVDPRFEAYSTKVTIESGKTIALSQTLKLLPVPKPPFGRCGRRPVTNLPLSMWNGNYGPCK
jgi:hypothetical protein